jgi:hypothetical protein
MPHMSNTLFPWEKPQGDEPWEREVYLWHSAEPLHVVIRLPWTHDDVAVFTTMPVVAGGWKEFLVWDKPANGAN